MKKHLSPEEIMKIEESIEAEITVLKKRKSMLLAELAPDREIDKVEAEIAILEKKKLAL